MIKRVQNFFKQRAWISGGLTLGVLLFLYFPIIVMMVFSFNEARVTTLPLTGFTLKWYRELFHDASIQASIKNSLYVAVASVGLASAFGIPLAYAVNRLRFPGKKVIRRVVLIPIILPGLVTGITLLNFFSLIGIKNSLITVIIGHATALISVVVTEVYAGLQQFDYELEAASHDLGASGWQTFRHITFPHLVSFIIGAAFIAFTMSFDEIPVTFFLIGSDNTLPMEIWTRLRRGITPEMNAIATLIILFSAVITILSTYFTSGSEVADQV